MQWELCHSRNFHLVGWYDFGYYALTPNSDTEPDSVFLCPKLEIVSGIATDEQRMDSHERSNAISLKKPIFTTPVIQTHPFLKRKHKQIEDLLN